MEIYKKLLSARDIIKNTKVKKEGKNTFSGYEYFTPSQISQLVHHACTESGLIHIYSLINNKDNTYTANLVIINTDKPEESVLFTIPTNIPDIKATNEAQRLGGAVTYSERYLLMVAFDIVDNSLDFDTSENTQKTVKKSEQKTDFIPEITEKFVFSQWNGEFYNENQIKYGKKMYTLSDKALKQLQDYAMQMLEIDNEYKQDLDILNGLGKDV